MTDLWQLNKLETYLKKHGIKYKRIDEDPVYEYGVTAKLERHQIYVYTEKGVFDVICHAGSYGHEEGLLEAMGYIVECEDSVEGWMTAEDVIRRIK